MDAGEMEAQTKEITPQNIEEANHE
jgi:hypothetical protein